MIHFIIVTITGCVLKRRQKSVSRVSDIKLVVQDTQQSSLSLALVCSLVQR